MADAYLSGEVKEKLTDAILAAEEYPDRFARNVTALRAVQPEPIPAQDISFQISSPWIPVEIYQQFMYEMFKTSNYRKEGRDAILIEFSPYTASYHITSKNAESDSVTVTQTYGTDCANAYDIFEDCLNMRSVEVRDPVEYRDDKGDKKTRYVLNKRETILAREKQAKIRAEFERWLFQDPARGAQMVKLYNDRFNTIRPRRYNGDDLILPDLSPTIKLREHQREVIAHGIYGDGNLLIGHEVGAGKTFSAVVITHTPQDEVIDDTVEKPDGEGETIKVQPPSKTTEPPFALRGKRVHRKMRQATNDTQVENYNKLLNVCGEILVHASYYMRYEAKGYDNLEIYATDEDIVSIGHPREVNGKTLYDPEIQFQIVDECRVVPLSFRNDNIGFLRETDTYTQAEKDDLDQFLSSWLDSIAEQPYELAEKRDTVEAADWDELMVAVGGHEDAEEVTV